MIREDGTSTIVPMLNGDQQTFGVSDADAGIQVHFDTDLQDTVMVSWLKKMPDGAHVPAFGVRLAKKDIGTIRDLLGRMMEVCAMPATN